MSKLTCRTPARYDDRQQHTVTVIRRENMYGIQERIINCSSFQVGKFLPTMISACVYSSTTKTSQAVGWTSGTAAPKFSQLSTVDSSSVDFPATSDSRRRGSTASTPRLSRGSSGPSKTWPSSTTGQSISVAKHIEKKLSESNRDSRNL